MKIYFAGSIRGGRADAAVYQSMIKYLSRFGEVLTEHVGDSSISDAGDDGPDDKHIHDRDMAWLAACDLIVAEVSAPSLGVGYELGHAVALRKPILCLYKSERPLSAMIAGSSGIRTFQYSSIDEAKKIMADFLNERR
ncbi:MAG TPA: nucleoside 2-deoxyribosyltransferase [Acidobacteriota bacterium]|nr:nucleoside 2-deoxyribosyltransferase [Acidobacteriota bacterium]